MRNKELEGKLRRAYSHAAPDVLDSVLSSCEDTKDKVIVMTEQKKRSPWIRRGMGIAAALVLLLGGAACEAAPAEAPAAAEPSAPAPMPAAREEKLVHVTKRVLTERDIRDAAAEKVTCIHVPAKCILTALAKDCAKEHGIRLVQE